MGGLLHADEDLAGMGPGEIFADGAELGEADGLFMSMKVLSGADVDALDARLFVQTVGRAMGSEVAAPVRTPIWAMAPPMRRARRERGRVPAPPTSTTRSTPSPVCSVAQRSHSGTSL